PEPEEPTEPEEPPVEPPVEPEPEIGIFYLEGKPTTVVMQSPDCDQPSWMDVPYGKLKIVLSSEMTPFTACWAATDRLDDQWVFKAHLEASPEGSLGKYLNGCSGTYLPEEQALKDVLSGGVCYEHVGNGATHWYYNGAFGVVCVQITHNPGP
ncbi:hypothetical protein KKG51_02850, partial [Patescibacteria group bacterium]|nr:hypothetical protein [Patescibacteria group bacterium]